MEQKQISLNGLKKVMDPNELKNVLGGSGDECWNYCLDSEGNNTISYWGSCYETYRECIINHYTDVLCNCNG